MTRFILFPESFLKAYVNLCNTIFYYLYVEGDSSKKPGEGNTKKEKAKVKPDGLVLKSRLAAGSSRGFRSKLAEAGGNPVDVLTIQRAEDKEPPATSKTCSLASRKMKNSCETRETNIHSDSDSSDSTESRTGSTAGGLADALSRSDTGGKQDQLSTNRKSLQQKKSRRSILFLGNLPLAASREDVVLHFRKRGVHVSEFRLLTHKDSGKSKGCGFMELDSDLALHSALKFHRSRLNGKTINVEVTCGGGGKGEKRRKKIQDKNRKLRLKKSVANPVKHRTRS